MLPSKRRLGLALAALVLAVFGLLPALAWIFPGFDAWQSGQPWSVTALLSPGPLSSGHAGLGHQCRNCHEQPLQAVADTACTHCHANVAPHPGAVAAHEALRCTACHPAHQGKAAAGTGATACLDCHARQGEALRGIRDFVGAHPSFHLDVPAGKGSRRIAQESSPPAEKLLEDNGLKFSHRLHLDPAGVSSPNGDTVLACRNCHRPDAAGERFLPMRMAETCQQSRCHKLRFEEPASGRITHGSEREVMQQLRLFYVRWLAETPEEAGRACASTERRPQTLAAGLDCADRLAGKHAASTLFRQEGEGLACALCHRLNETGNDELPWKVAPVRVAHDWQPKAVFPHARHDTVPCNDCHDKAQSTRSEDVAFPEIGRCRQCHAGAVATAGRVASSCADCHRFHGSHRPDGGDKPAAAGVSAGRD